MLTNDVISEGPYFGLDESERAGDPWMATESFCVSSMDAADVAVAEVGIML